MAGNDHTKEIQAAVQYLTSAQNEDGSWGLASGMKGVFTRQR
jgi:squalene cyclase